MTSAPVASLRVHEIGGISESERECESESERESECERECESESECERECECACRPSAPSRSRDVLTRDDDRPDGNNPAAGGCEAFHAMSGAAAVCRGAAAGKGSLPLDADLSGTPRTASR